jgi:hypothetical protein
MFNMQSMLYRNSHLFYYLFSLKALHSLFELLKTTSEGIILDLNPKYLHPLGFFSSQVV